MRAPHRAVAPPVPGRDTTVEVRAASPAEPCCPRCRGRLRTARCAGCGEAFPATRGILDLRWPRPAPADADEAALVAAMLERYDGSTFDDLADLVRRARFRDFSAELQEGLRARSATRDGLGQAMMDMFERRLARHYTVPGRAVALDLGCGYGTSSAVLARRFNRVIGLDPYLPVLLLARKGLDDRGVQNVTLIQAYAQCIPLADGCVDYAVAQNVIEHLISVRPAFAEVRRVLRPGGCFCGDSRNRYDLLFPEPHVKLRWVGLWPRRLQGWYVRRLKHVSYADAHARLLSWRELRAAARQAFGDSVRVVLPHVSAYGQPASLDRWIERLEAVPVAGRLAPLLFPSHLLLAQASRPLAPPARPIEGPTS
jgi:SAM-dependent methyltransferase